MISSQMSQSHHPTDSQALLQSMLQKLKLQPGRDGHMHLQAPTSPATASTLGQDEARGAPVPGVDISTVKVFGFSNTSSKELTPPAKNLKQQPDLGHEVGRSRTSFSSKKVTTDGETGESRMLGLATPSGFTFKETEPMFPPQASKNGNFAFFKRTDSERGSFSSSAVTNHIPPNANTASSTSPNQNQVQGFTPTWSPPHPAAEEHKALHVETQGTDHLRRSSDVQIFSSNQTTTNVRKSQRSSENKTKRWTQRIKDRWKEKHSKKGKEDGGTADQRTEQGAQISASDQIKTAGNLTNTPNNHGGTTIPSWSSSFPNRTLPAQSEDTTDNSSRRNSEFDIGLGSFSLLDEILNGQEWGKFINPNLTTPSVNQREEPLSQPKVQPNPYNTNQSPGSLNQLGFGSNQWSFRSTESSAATVFSTTPAFPSAHMDVSQPKQQQFVHREADQPEPMDDGLNQSDVQRRASGPLPHLRPSSCVEPILYDAMLKVRGQTNRKRHHQPMESRDERLQTDKTSDGETAGRGRSVSCPVPTSPQMMDDSMESQQADAPSFLTPASPPLSPSVYNPSAPTPRGVLKKSPSKDLESSMETLTKRRRVEENRRVTFSEHVVSIESPSLDLDFTDSEDDSGAEEDSLTDQECEVEQVEQVEGEEVLQLQARRSNLPAWIKALKKMNAGKKHR